MKVFRNSFICLAVVALLFVHAISARANELTKFTTVCNTDYAAVGVGGMMKLGIGHLALTNAVAPGSVTKALLYWSGQIPKGTVLDPNGQLLVNTTLNGIPISGTHLGFSSPNGWSFAQASQGCRADVTAIVNALGTGTYTFQGLTNISGASLLVFFDDGNAANNRDIIIYNGNDSNEDAGFDSAGWDLHLTGFLYNGSGDARLHLHVSDGQASFADAAIMLNGQLFVPGRHIFLGDSVPWEDNYGLFPSTFALGDTRLWDIKTYDFSAWLSTGLNNILMTASAVADVYSLIVAAIDVPAGGAVDCGASLPPPTINHPPGVNCSGPAVIEANASGLASPTVAAHVTDEDGDPLLATWKLDGNVIQTTSIPATAPDPLDTNLTFKPALTPRFAAYQVEITVADPVAAPNTCRASITVVEPIPPVINCGLPYTAYAQPNGVGFIPDVNPLISATDNVTPRNLLQVSQLPAIGTPVIPGTYDVTVVVKDEAGNFSVCHKTIIVLDNPTTPNQAPAIDCGAPITVISTSPDNTAVVPNVLNQVVVSDDFTPLASLVLTQTPSAGMVVPMGTNDIVVTVRDEGGKTASCTKQFIVLRANAAPILDCGAPIRVVEDASGNGVIPNVLTQISVTDDYTPAGSLVLSQSPAAGTVVPKGNYTITVTARDGAGLTSTCGKLFTVASRQIIPTVDCALDTGELWPPNHRMATIGLTATAQNIVGSLEVRVYADEDDEEMCGTAPYPADEWDWDRGKNKGSGLGWGDGNFSPDADVSPAGDFMVRAERRGDRDGRVYLIVVKGTSETGDSSYCIGAVTVPHDQSAASRESVRLQAAAAMEYFAAHHAPPSNYVVVGDGPLIGPKDGANENGNSANSAKIFKTRQDLPTMILKF